MGLGVDPESDFQVAVAHPKRFSFSKTSSDRSEFQTARSLLSIVYHWPLIF